ncbi:MAG: Rpn family recombination-promoting nuclease/putative transposase [Prevotellaceae bacterium]|jgi:predicted transposase/invertase (TIGR01784 family)|nr:Rpn family recombination-promoting nuclease/putative transposase [Prevotellaceae bacterium]
MATYINPFTDFGFKKIFGSEANKDLLINFLQILLQNHEGKITTLRYLKNDQLPYYSKSDRAAVYDIFCETDHGEKIIVELQKAKQDFFKDRSVFYSTFPIRKQAKRGTWNFHLNAVYTIGILDFVFEEDKNDLEKFLYHVQLSDTETHKVFYDKLTFIYLELPKFKKQESELETLFDKWMYVLKNLAKLQRRPPALQERIFKKLFKIAEIEALAPSERDAYDESLKRYWDLQNVIDSAARRAREHTAKEKDTIIREKEEAIKEKEAVIKGQEEAIKEKEETIKGQEEAIKKKEQLLKKKKAEKEKLIRAQEAEKEKLIRAQEAEKEAIVKNLLQKGALPNFIAEVTGFDLRRIKQIKSAPADKS